MLCEKLTVLGAPIARATVHVRTLHPEFRGISRIWRRGQSTEFRTSRHGIESTSDYQNSPLQYVIETGQLCVPQFKPEHIGDAVHPGSDGTECVPLPRRHVISARLCSTISECACHYSSPCRTAAHGADGVRRTPQYDRGIPCGSSRSTVLRMRFARASAETSDGLECRST